jgi:hypothetical protein
VASKVCKRFTDLNATRDCLQRLSGRFVDLQVIPICERWFHTSDQVTCLEKLSDRRYTAAEFGVCDRYDRGNPALAQDCLAGMRQPRRGPAPQPAEGGAYRCTDPNLLRDLMAARQKLRDGDSDGGVKSLTVSRLYQGAGSRAGSNHRGARSRAMVDRAPSPFRYVQVYNP